MFFAKYIQKIDLISKFIDNGATTTTDSVLLPAIVATTVAEYLRVGNDLVIKIPGDSLVLHDYFIHPVVLKTELGETLPVAKVIALVNEHPQPILVAANDNVALQTALEKIGKIIATVEGPVTAQDTTSNTRTLNKGDSVYLHDTIVTVARSYVKIALNDGTVLQLGPLSRCSLDKYSYDPSSKTGGTFEASVFTGFFRYISGKISGNTGEQHTVITTPSANIGIRGSEIDAQIDQDGSTTVLHLAGLVSVSSRYRPGEEIVVYERGTTIYIPNDRAAASTSTATENQIQEKDHEWQIFNVVSPIGEVVMESKSVVVGNVSPTVEKVAPPTEAPREGPGPESHAPGPVPPDHHPDRPPLRDEGPHNMPLDRPERPGPPPLDSRLEPGPMKPGEPENHNEGPKPPVGEWPNEPGNLSDNLHGMLPHEDNHPLPPPPESETPPPPPPPPPREPVNQVIAVTLKEDEATIVPVSGPLNQLIQPEHGKVVDNGNGTLTYTPIANFNGEDKFTFTPDGNHSITVNLSIAAVNDPPIAHDAKETTLEDQNLILSQADFLKQNVTDVDEGDKLSIVSVNSSVDTHGQVFLDEKGNIVYSPAPNFNGDAQFTYTVQDSQGARDTARVIVNVIPVNDPPTANPDFFTIDTKTSWTISADSLVANDKDVENDHLTVVKVLNPEEGTVLLDKGEITFTPGPNFTQGGFDYVVSDGEKTDTGQVTITLHEKPNLPPLARDETVSTTSAHDSLTIAARQLLANDADPENDPLTIIAVKDGNNGSVRLDNSGNVVFTPASEFVNQKVGNFTYQISDGHGNLANATAVVTLNNMPPKANDDSITTNSVAPVTIAASQLLANDQDPENNALRIDVLHNGNNSSVAFDRQGNIVFTPDGEFVKQGVGNFTYQVNDDNGNTATATVTVSLTNRPPLAGPDLVTTDNTRPLTITASQLLANDSDPDGDPLKISNVNNGQNGTVKLDNQGNVVFTGDANFSLQREGNFTYDLTDGQGHTATATVTVKFTNLPPTAQDVTISTLNLSPVRITVNQLPVHDSEGDTLKISNVSHGQNGTVTLDNQGQIVFIPDAAFAKQGTGAFSYQVSDGYGNSNIATVTIDGPKVVANDDSLPPTHHNTPITITANQLLANDIFPTGEPPKISNVSDSQHGTVKLDNQGNIVFTPDGDFVKQGSGKFTYEITDSQGHSDTAVVTVPFQNEPPIATPDTITTHDLTKVTITANQLLANDRDPDGDQLTISNVSAGQNGSIKLGGDDNIIFSPDQNFVKDGKGSFTYDISDGYNHTASATVTVTLVNKTPLAKDDGPFNLGYENSRVISKADLLKNDSDSDSDPLTLTLVPNSGVNGTAVLNKDGDVLFTRDLTTPPADSGPSTRAGAAEFKGGFDYEINDGHGGKAQAHVVVMGKNDQPPVANDDQATTSKNKPVAISLTYSDPDLNDTVTISQISQPLDGTLSAPDKQGQVTYTPADNFTGKDSFTYTIKDSHGATDTATVNVTVTNTPPQAVADDLLSTTTNTPLSLPASQLLSNDTDADPGDQETLQVVKVDNAANGTVNLSNGEITFTPTTGFEGKTNFTYTIADRSGDQSSALVTVAVTKGLQAIDDTLPATVKNTAVTTPAEELLANDIKGHPNDTLIISAVSNPQHGTVVQDTKGNITFTPDSDFAGQASFDYTATDNRGQSDQATVTLTVKAEPLVAKDDNVTTTVNTPLTLPTSKVDLLANDTGEGISIFDVTNASHGQVKLNGTQVVFTPDRDFTGEASFDYTLQDTYGDKATATVNVAIKPINLPPLVTLPGQSTPLIYKAGDSAQFLDSNATVSDPDSPDFDTGKLQVAITANRTRGDLLEIQNTGAISVSNPSSGLVSFNGTTIGNFTTLFTTGALLISLNAQATPETTTALLQAIAYRNTATDPSAETRTVSVTLSDGDGGTSAVVSRDIQLDFTHSPPKTEPDQFDRPFNAHTTLSVSDLLANDTDPNPNDILNVTQLTHPSPGVEVNLVGDEIQLFIDGLVSRNFNSATFDYTISNGQGTEDTATVTITPTNVITGTPNADQLVATADQNIVLGNGGDDTFAPSKVPSILLGGDGNDLFLFDPATAAGVYIDGGKGTDTLSLNGASNKIIDLPKNDDSPADQKFELHGIDIIDLTGRGNQLRLNIKDVLDMTDNGKLEIHGDSTSMVTSSGQGWINQGIDSSGLYHHYTAPTGTAELLVSTEIAFQLIT